MKKILTVMLIMVVAMTSVFADAFIAFDDEDFICVFIAGEDLRYIDIENYCYWDTYMYYDDSIIESHPEILSEDIIKYSALFSEQYLDGALDLRVITEGTDIIYIMSNWWNGVNCLMEYLEENA